MMEHNILTFTYFRSPWHLSSSGCSWTPRVTAFYATIKYYGTRHVAVKYQYEFIIVLIVCRTCCYLFFENYPWSQILFLTALLVTIGSAAVCFSLQLIQARRLVRSFTQTMYYHFLQINGFFLIFTYPLMLVREDHFGFVSTVTMFELFKSPIVEALCTTEWGGTRYLQNSITVGNLLAEIYKQDWAKSQLVRTGSTLLDIGKMATLISSLNTKLE